VDLPPFPIPNRYAGIEFTELIGDAMNLNENMYYRISSPVIEYFTQRTYTYVHSYGNIHAPWEP
jgi:hypothetical protein